MAVPSPSPSGQLDGAAPRPRRNYALDILRIVSIVGVVAIHSFGELAGDDDARSQPDWLPAAIIDIAFIWVVPVFVTISGALVLAPRAHAEGAKAFYRKRALRLLPALVVWHLVYIFIGNYLILGRELQPARGAGVSLRHPGVSAPLLPVADPGPVPGGAAPGRLPEPGSAAARRGRDLRGAGADPGAVQPAGGQHPVRVGLGVSVEHPDPVAPLSGLLHGRLGHHAAARLPRCRHGGRRRRRRALRFQHLALDQQGFHPAAQHHHAVRVMWGWA